MKLRVAFLGFYVFILVAACDLLMKLIKNKPIIMYSLSKLLLMSIFAASITYITYKHSPMLSETKKYKKLLLIMLSSLIFAVVVALLNKDSK